ncbi:hypothetical protein [Polyangium sorediatum]|uniref:Lipoprotein n=1 Tax=Polyangium sorediatum TaxID=889274 RepID=A0ABT6NMC3_9BACT|nr:hypothetical protein [Polyangium sorediatum]MDI1429471.1 hypothetical protein [Polyangium sorediatum]
MRDAWMRTDLLLCGVVGMAVGCSQEDCATATGDTTFVDVGGSGGGQASPPVPHETFDTP